MEKEDIKNENNLLVKRFANREINFETIYRVSPQIYLESAVPNARSFQTFFDPFTTFPSLKEVYIELIEKELKTFSNKVNWINWPEYNLWQTEIGNWQVLPLMCFGKWREKYTKMFPETVKELEKIPNLVNAGFSKLSAQTRLILHRGWGELSNRVLRCHLGLIVPNDCFVYVVGNGYHKMKHTEREWIVFDDSLYHSASNDSNEGERIILLLDIERPHYIPKGDSDVKNTDELKQFLNQTL